MSEVSFLGDGTRGQHSRPERYHMTQSLAHSLAQSMLHSVDNLSYHVDGIKFGADYSLRESR